MKIKPCPMSFTNNKILKGMQSGVKDYYCRFVWRIYDMRLSNYVNSRSLDKVAKLSI